MPNRLIKGPQILNMSLKCCLLTWRRASETTHWGGSSVKPSKEAGAEEPLAEALEATAVSEAGRLCTAVGPPAWCPTSRK